MSLHAILFIPDGNGFNHTSGLKQREDYLCRHSTRPLCNWSVSFQGKTDDAGSFMLNALSYSRHGDVASEKAWMQNINNMDNGSVHSVLTVAIRDSSSWYAGTVTDSCFANQVNMQLNCPADDHSDSNSIEQISAIPLSSVSVSSPWVLFSFRLYQMPDRKHIYQYFSGINYPEAWLTIRPRLTEFITSFEFYYISASEWLTMTRWGIYPELYPGKMNNSCPSFFIEWIKGKK